MRPWQLSLSSDIRTPVIEQAADNFHNRQVAGSEASSEAAILGACKNYTEAQMLYSLGIQLSVPRWQQHWLHLAAAEKHTPLKSDPAMTSVTASSPRYNQQQQGAEHAGLSLDFNQLLQLSPPRQPAHSQDSRQQAASDVAVSDVAFDAQTDGSNEQVLVDPTVAEEHSQACQQIIGSICETEFGIGVQLDSVGTDLRQKQNDRLGRALHRLSQDLYSKDVHFVLELVQNADDNMYDADICPALEFQLDEHGITVLNNEVWELAMHYLETHPCVQTCSDLLCQRAVYHMCDLLTYHMSANSINVAGLHSLLILG